MFGSWKSNLRIINNAYKKWLNNQRKQEMINPKPIAIFNWNYQIKTKGKLGQDIQLNTHPIFMTKHCDKKGKITAHFNATNYNIDTTSWSPIKSSSLQDYQDSKLISSNISWEFIVNSNIFNKPLLNIYETHFDRIYETILPIQGEIPFINESISPIEGYYLIDPNLPSLSGLHVEMPIEIYYNWQTSINLYIRQLRNN